MARRKVPQNTCEHGQVGVLVITTKNIMAENHNGVYSLKELDHDTGFRDTFGFAVCQDCGCHVDQKHLRGMNPMLSLGEWLGYWLANSTEQDAIEAVLELLTLTTVPPEKVQEIFEKALDAHKLREACYTGDPRGYIERHTKFVK